jgi:nitroreductase
MKDAHVRTTCINTILKTEPMILSELLEKRRSIRNFEEKEVPLELIRDIINDSILAPSAGNGQPWEFIIITDQEMLNRISIECKNNLLQRIASNPGDYATRYEKMLQKEYFHIFYHAPAVIYILGRAGLKNLYVDCALAASYLMMSATSRGLGTCWVNFGTEIHDPVMRKELGIGDHHKIVAPIALGYPAKIPGIPHRKEPQILRIIE